MGFVGWVLIVLGVLAIIIGLVEGAKDIFEKSNQGAAMGSLPTEFLKVIGRLLDAGPAKFFTIFGLLLVVIGLGLNGVALMDDSDDDGDASTPSLESVVA